MMRRKDTDENIVSGVEDTSVTIQDGCVNKINGEKIDNEQKETSEFIIRCNNEIQHIGEVVGVKQNEYVIEMNGNTYHFTI